jgi:hypothetical protein
VREELVMRYSEKGDAVESAQRMMDRARAHIGRMERAKYNDVKPIIDASASILHQVNIRDLSGAVSLSVIVIRAMMEILEHMEKDEMFEIVNDAVDNIDTVLEVLKEDDPAKYDIFENILDLFDDTSFPYYPDTVGDILRMMVPFAEDPRCRDMLETFLEGEDTYAEILGTLTEQFGSSPLYMDMDDEDDEDDDEDEEFDDDDFGKDEEYDDDEEYDEDGDPKVSVRTFQYDLEDDD